MNVSGDAAVRLADAIEAAAMRDMYAAAQPELGLRTEVVAGATLLLAPRIPVSYFNRVIGLETGPAANEADLDAVMAVYRAAGISNYWIHLGPGAAAAALQEGLHRRGFAPAQRRSWAKFLRGPDAPPRCATELPLRPATRTDAGAIAETVCAAYGMPPTLAPWFAALVGRPGWEFRVGVTDGERIVATGAVYLHEGAGWVGVGATLSEFRGRGAQSALLAERIEVAAAAGCTVLATETGEAVGDEANPSLSNIRRCGFEQVGSRLNFAAPA